jgi:putative oxidoreductase
MKASFIRSSDLYAWNVLRIVIALLIAVHGVSRWWAGAVEPFATWLASQGVPFGKMVAVSITAFEIVGALLLVSLPWGRRWIALTACTFAAIYVVGIAMVHAKAGWFVVGLGRNGAEFSVLLITVLLSIAARDISIFLRSRSHR